jgi:hypothetical protein
MSLDRRKGDEEAIGIARPRLGRGHRSFGYFPLVRGEGRQDFTLLASRDPEVIKRASQFRRDFIELLGGDVQVAMGLFEPERSTAGFRGVE